MLCDLGQGNAWNGFPARASMCSNAGSFGAGIGGRFKILSMSFTPNALHTYFCMLDTDYVFVD